MREVLVLQHTVAETPGTIAEVISQHGIGIHTVRSFIGEAVPTHLGDRVGLIVMGGPMGVYEDDKYNFLRNELHLIEQVLQENKPVLGICLGSQLLAAVLGADVKKGVQKEIGWYPVQLSKGALLDTIWKEAPQKFTAFHWHGDVFNVPEDAVLLASSELTPCQAFRYGTNAYGLLFHLEATEGIINDMVRAFDDELARARIDARRITKEVRNNLPASQKIGTAVFDRWCALLDSA